MMPEGNRRPLGYELSFSADVESQTPNDPPVSNQTLADLFPDDPDERTDIVLNLSLNEYVALASCIDVGRDIAYGSSSLYIWWIWCRAVSMVDYCAIIADCIQTSTDVQNAINGYLGERGLMVIPDDNPAITESLLDGGCDPDIVFGQVTAVWNVINNTTIDFLQILSAAGNLAEAQAEVISAIPIIGQLPADEIIDFVGKFGEWTLDAYEAFLTTALENEIKCDLFCLAMDADGCVLTTADLIDYFAGRVGSLSSVRIETIEDFIQFIIDLPTNVATLFVCGMSLTQLYIVSLLERFLGFSTIQAYIAFARLGDPSDDWIALCDECSGVFTHTFDFTASDGGFSIVTSGITSGVAAVYQAGIGWRYGDATYGTARRRIVYLIRSFTATRIILVRVKFNLSKGTWSNPAESQEQIDANPMGVLNIYNADTISGDDQYIELTGDDTISDFSLRILSSLTNTASFTGSVLVTEVTVMGIGDDPF